MSLPEPQPRSDAEVSAYLQMIRDGNSVLSKQIQSGLLDMAESLRNEIMQADDLMAAFEVQQVIREIQA